MPRPTASCGDALRRLEACERRFASETPFAFYAWLLGGDGGRARILRRLGHEANDALDEFLELALNYERKAPASLQGFMAWLRTADTEVKRDMEISRDEVRVMTVHGAKGLEASGRVPGGHHDVALGYAAAAADPPAAGQCRPHAPGVVVWAGRKAEDPPAVVAARAAMIDETEDEYRRLLYVAMTRAADRLIVGGCMPGNMRSVRPLSWYDLIDKGLAGSGLQLQEIETAAGPGETLYASRRDRAVGRSGSGAVPRPAPLVLPDWLRTPAQPETSAGQVCCGPRTAADSARHPVRTAESMTQRARALQRGTLVHRLLQSLPDIAAARRREAALAYLARNAEDWTEDERQALADKHAGLDRRCRASRRCSPPAAGPRSRSSAGWSGRAAGRRWCPGRSTGWSSRPDEVLIVDFKTNHAPPSRPDEAPGAYVRQLALYRAVLRQALSPAAGPRRRCFGPKPLN